MQTTSSLVVGTTTPKLYPKKCFGYSILTQDITPGETTEGVQQRLKVSLPGGRNVGIVQQKHNQWEVLGQPSTPGNKFCNDHLALCALMRNHRQKPPGYSA